MADIKDIDALIVAHRLAVEDFRNALRGGNADREDRAFEEEAYAMLALLSFPPATIEQDCRRAAYLVGTRFPDSLDVEGRALLYSFIRSDYMLSIVAGSK